MPVSESEIKITDEKSLGVSREQGPKRYKEKRFLLAYEVGYGRIRI